MSARYNPRKDHSVRRRAGFKQVKKTFLIVCEGVNTEPEYFNAFRLTSATVKVNRKGFAKMLFQILLPFQSTAITNAEAAISEMQGVKPSLAESSTMVHNLVKKLNEYSD